MTIRALALYLVTVAAPLSLHALYSGCPALPAIPEENWLFQNDSPFSLKTGYEGNFLLSQASKTSEPFHSPHLRFQWQAGSLCFNFMNRVELFTLLGTFQTTVSAKKEEKNIHLKTNPSLGGEIGTRILAFFWRELKVGLEGSYFYGWPSLDSLTRGEESLPLHCKRSFNRTWQVSASLSQTFAFITPYAGVKYTKSVLQITESKLDSLFRVENTHPFGVFVGLALAGRKGLFLDLEAEFLSAYAFSGALGLRF